MLFSRLWSSYNNALLRSPLVTKCLTVSGLSILGDGLAQTISRSKAGAMAKPYDAERALRMGLFGLCIGGPMNHYWYKALDRFVVGAGMKANLTKLAADQFLFAPVILTTFFTSISVMEGKSVQQSIDHTKQIVPGALKMNYTVWPVAQFINFTFVPAPHRVGYVSAILVFWNAYLSTTQNH